MEIGATSILYAKRKKTRMKNEEDTLELEIKNLQSELEDCKTECDRNLQLTKLEDRKQKLEKLIEYKTKGSIIRAKIRWYNEGEKNAKYFLNMEKRHFNKKTIKSLKTGPGITVNSDKKIIEEAERFYQKLYTSLKPSPDLYSQIFFSESEECKLGDSQKESCEGQLTPGECLQALKLMENNKSLGSDGLPAELYKIFWHDIHVFLINALNAAYRKVILSISQQRSVISLLPKKTKIVHYLKNWRPITLLNCNYKIAAKAIASRI